MGTRVHAVSGFWVLNTQVQPCNACSALSHYDTCSTVRHPYYSVLILYCFVTFCTILHYFAGILNLFWGVLLFKKKAEKALQASGIPYVIVRPGGMEKPTDAYKRTHNVRLAPRDKLFGGQVSRLQVAELIAAAVSNPDVAENKVRVLPHTFTKGFAIKGKGVYKILAKLTKTSMYGMELHTPCVHLCLSRHSGV